MDPFEINLNFAELADDALEAYRLEARKAFDELSALPTPTADQVAEAEGLADHIDEVAALQSERVTAATELDARKEALKNRFNEDQAEAEAEEIAEDEDKEEPEEEVEEPAAEEAAGKAKAAGTVKTLAAKTQRPVAPAVAQPKPITITASADVPEFATGSELNMDKVGQALINRMRGFAPPSGNGEGEDLHKYGVASFKMDFPEELTIDRHTDDMEVLTHAANEYRLPGDSLVAAGGWCAPSEQLYDLCTGETTEGILSLPEINIARGGLKYTKGPDFAAIYAAVGFLQTEAQAIAGTTKTCYEVPCPSFSEVRLDAIGLCIKAPILTNSAYPELVQRWLSGSMIAHQHKVNASVITRMVTIAGAARVFTGLGSAMADTLEAMELVADQRRELWRLSFTASLEVVVPFWVKGAFRSDLGRRNGRDASAVSDQEIAAHFAARHIAVQYVYDWQPITLTPEVYPATYQALMYPAGTFVKGTSDVISLNAVYDAASLAVNIYTALFFEEGLLVANLCYDADLLTLPICTAGRSGAPNFTCA